MNWPLGTIISQSNPCGSYLLDDIIFLLAIFLVGFTSCRLHFLPVELSVGCTSFLAALLVGEHQGLFEHRRQPPGYGAGNGDSHSSAGSFSWRLFFDSVTVDFYRTGHLWISLEYRVVVENILGLAVYIAPNGSALYRRV